MLGGGKKKKQSKVKQRQQIKRETRKQNRALKRDTRLSNNKKKQPVNIKQRSKVYSKTRKQYRALKRDARFKKLQEQFGLSNSLKSISNKLSEHLSESSEFKSASEKYSENGLRVKSIEENNSDNRYEEIFIKNETYDEEKKPLNNFKLKLDAPTKTNDWTELFEAWDVFS